MRHIIALLMLFTVMANVHANDEPIIDMHLHFYTQEAYAPNAPHPPSRQVSPPTVDEHLATTLQKMDDHNIVKAVASAPFGWENPDPGRLIQGVEIWSTRGLDFEAIEAGMKSGEIGVVGEFGTVYTGSNVLDEGFRPLFALAEKYDVPVAWHTGEGPPLARSNKTAFRIEMSNPLLLQDILNDYPNLRVYLMHAGGVIWQDEALAMMHLYRNLYVDIGVLTWVDPYVTSHLDVFLKAAKKAGFLDRVMFGTDQMRWPGAIDIAVDAIRQADYLSEEEKRNIMYNNAARFLRMEE